ncbi:MAG: DUF499 domain-containing protein [Crenarchaeota archaeon]|nr:DUF499 domain-containing protein [Thermoproteota archaeon]
MLKPFYEAVKLRDDVFDESLDSKMAPDLGSVFLEKEHEIYVNPASFFERTLITESMLRVLRAVAETLSGRAPSRLILLNSLFGGGKTHTMLTLLHAVRKPSMLSLASLEDEGLREELEEVKEMLLEAKPDDVIVVDGHASETTPKPLDPVKKDGFKIHTLWGYIAYLLGKYPEYRSYDEKLVPPSVDKIIDLFRGRKLLILIDEIANYVDSLKKSRDEKIKDYADQVITFLENLAKAVEALQEGNVVAVISLPKSGEEVERRYRDVVHDIARALGRIALPYTPVAAKDFPKILRVRLFKEIDEKYAKELSQAYLSEYSKEREHFGTEAFRRVHEIQKTFPFHPDFIDVLKTIIENHKGLQKTRDAIRLSRIVVRELFKNKEQTSLIMPYHLDPEDSRMKGILFVEEFEPFAQVVDEDISRRAKEYEDPELASRIAKYVLLKTFTISRYAIHGNITLLPSRKDVLRSTYEILSNAKFGWSVPDYLRALEWLSESAGYLYERDGRYWFERLKDINSMIEEVAENVSREEAEQRLLEILEEIYPLSPPSDAEEAKSYLRGRKRKRREEGVLFRGNVQVLERAEPQDLDEPNYHLLILAQKPSREELYDLIYRRPKGAERRYANTIYLTYVSSVEKLENVLRDIKRCIACDKLKENLKEYLASLSEEEVEIISSKLKKKCDRIYANTVSHIYAMFDEVAYPVFDDEQNRKDVKSTKISSATYSIVKNVEHKLSAEDKLYSKEYQKPLDFETLVYFAGPLNGKSVAEVEERFLTNPKLPAVPKEELKDAIMEGVEERKIAIEREGEVLINIPMEERRCEGEKCDTRSITSHIPDSPQPQDKLMDIADAFKAFVKGLNPFKEDMTSEREISKGSLVEVVRYYAETPEGDRLEIEELLEEDEESLREQIESIKIVREVRVFRKGIIITVEPEELEARPGEEVELKVRLRGVGGFEGTVVLETEEGAVGPQSVTFGEGTDLQEAVWRIRVPQMPGAYEYTLKAKYDSEEKKVTVRISVIAEEAVKSGVPERAKYLELEASNTLEHFNILHKRLSGAWRISRLEVDAWKDETKISSKLIRPTWEQAVKFIMFIVRSMNNPQYRYRLELESEEERPLPFSEEEKEALKSALRYR